LAIDSCSGAAADRVGFDVGFGAATGAAGSADAVAVLAVGEVGAASVSSGAGSAEAVAVGTADLLPAARTYQQFRFVA
jgi:hypothetical protein